MSRIIKNGLVYGGIPVWEGTQAEYDALPTKDSTTIYFISDGVFPPDSCNYSTTEQVVGTWIDGSTLYERLFIFTKSDFHGGTQSTSELSGAFFLPHELWGICWIVDGFVTRTVTGGNLYCTPINYFANTGSFIRANIQSKSTENDGYNFIFVQHKYDVQAYYNAADTQYIFTIRYTKSSS